MEVPQRFQQAFLDTAGTGGKAGDTVKGLFVVSGPFEIERSRRDWIGGDGYSVSETCSWQGLVSNAGNSILAPRQTGVYIVWRSALHYSSRFAAVAENQELAKVSMRLQICPKLLQVFLRIGTVLGAERRC
jgi:hypothetical protein